MSEFYLSVVIPVYNEEKRIGNTLASIANYLKNRPYASEIIIVDDGSTDRTVEIVPQALKSNDLPYKLLRNPQNRGKGAAVKQGMLTAIGKFILFTDADLSTPIEEVERFLRYLETGYDCVIGSRGLEKSKIEVHQNLLRELMGKTFNRLAHLLAFTDILDSQCGFKCFRKEVAHSIFKMQKLEGFAFDAETIYLMQKHHFKIKEEPVIWRNEKQSRVKIFRDPVLMFSDLLRIKRLHRDD